MSLEQLIEKFIRRHGLAWHDYSRNEGVCIIMPFNIIASMSRGIYIWFRHGYKAVNSNPRDAYHQGINNRDES